MGVKRDEPYSISTPDKGGLGGGGRMFRREKEKVGEDMGEGEEGHLSGISIKSWHLRHEIGTIIPIL